MYIWEHEQQQKKSISFEKNILKSRGWQQN
jgi:hypothetical protein